MAEFGELNDDVQGIGASLVQGAHDRDGLPRFAAHRALEERDDLTSIRKAKHLADGQRPHAIRAAMRDRLVEKRQRVAHRTLRDPGDNGQGFTLGGHTFQPTDFLEMRDHGGGVNSLQIEADAARPHRDRNLLDLGGREQELDVLGGFLQRLQKTVEGLLREHVHFVDNIDLGSRRDRPVAGVLDNLAHVVDTGVRGRVHLDYVDVTGIHNRLAVDAKHRHIQGRLVDPARHGIVEGASQDAGGGCLARSPDAGEDIGLMDALQAKSVGECADDWLLAD